MESYGEEDWLKQYQSALLELEHAKMTGRIEDARGAIIARLEKLQGLSTLHPKECVAISDAQRSLSFLEREEKKFQTEEQRRILDEAAEKLKLVEPAIKRLSRDSQ